MTATITTDERRALRESGIRLAVTHTPAGVPMWNIIDTVTGALLPGIFDNETGAAVEAFDYLAEREGQ